MFEKARIRLTTWYLLIIMAISLIFSIAIYARVNSDLNRFQRIRVRVEQETKQDSIIPQLSNTPQFTKINPEELEQSRIRLVATLIFINLSILILAGGAGYFLAGRTLKPIKEMVDEQNRFIADASHELRTPITVLKSEIEVNLRDKKLNSQKAREILESNLEEVNHLQILSDSLLLLSQNKQPAELNMKKVSLSEVVSEAVSHVKKISKEKEINILNKVNNISVYGNHESLTKLFVILLDNAIKYSGKNGKVTITSEKSNDSTVKIQVSDNGIGISKDDLPHIFDRFYRSDKSRTKDGYGLGLSIAKQITDNHRGTIHVKSESRIGTIFIISLPIKNNLL